MYENNTNTTIFEDAYVDNGLDITEIKIKINTFLFENLPDSTTLKEVENIALAFLEYMMEAWEKK